MKYSLGPNLLSWYGLAGYPRLTSNLWQSSYLSLWLFSWIITSGFKLNVYLPIFTAFLDIEVRYLPSPLSGNVRKPGDAQPAVTLLPFACQVGLALTQVVILRCTSDSLSNRSWNDRRVLHSRETLTLFWPLIFILFMYLIDFDGRKILVFHLCFYTYLCVQNKQQGRKIHFQKSAELWGGGL